MIRLRSLATVLAVLAPVAAQAPNHWIYLDSMETATGPKLVVHLTRGGTKTIAAEMDTVLIEYLADKAWDRLPALSIDKEDKNRSLLRFAVPKGMKIRRAELRANAHPSKMAPWGDTVFQVHRITSDWDKSATWKNSPSFEEKAHKKVLVPHGGGAVAFEVTDLVKTWAEKPSANFGILVRVLRDHGPPKVKPEDRPKPPMTPMRRQKELGDRVKTALPWLTSTAEALAVARKEKKPVFAFVVSDSWVRKGTAHERALAANVLLDPALRQLIERRFVPLRLKTEVPIHLAAKAGRKDPLRPLGTDAVEAKSPALIVCTAAGKKVGVLASVGTWDRDLVVGFLLDTLSRAKPPAGMEEEELVGAGYVERARRVFEPRDDFEATRQLLRLATLTGDYAEVLRTAGELRRASALGKGMDAVALGRALVRLGKVDEAKKWLRGRDWEKDSDAALAAAYWLGVAEHRSGDAKAARTAWQSIAGHDPESRVWKLRAELRLQWTDGIDELSSVAPVRYRKGMRSSEVARDKKATAELVGQSVRHLLHRQKPDGRWAHPGHPPYDAAITSLVAKALDTWSDQMPRSERGAISKAIERAEGWCARYLKTVDKEGADSFGAAYLLDYLVTRAPRGAAARKLVSASIELLLAGQLDNGSWSYNRRFGQGWRGGFGGWPKTDKGRAHSINTGLALWALARAKRAGFAIPKADVDRGVEALEAMRISATTFTYTWPDPPSFTAPDQSIGKAPVCLEALVALGARPERDLKKTVEEFMKWRKGLRATVKLTSSWNGPSGTSSYFFFQSYYHAAEAVAALGGKRSAKRLAALRDDILAVAEVDGTWVDYEETGKTYGTATALLILARARQQ